MSVSGVRAGSTTPAASAGASPPPSAASIACRAGAGLLAGALLACSVGASPAQGAPIDTNASNPIAVEFQFGNHYVPDGTYGDRRGDHKQYGAKVHLPSAWEVHYGADIYTPTDRVQWQDTARCYLGASKTVETQSGWAATLGADVGLRNGMCYELLVDVQNTVHAWQGRTSPRQSPPSSDSALYAGVTGRAVSPSLLEVGPAELKVDSGVDLNTLYGRADVAARVDAPIGKYVDVTAKIGIEATGWDDRNVGEGANPLNGFAEVGVTAKPAKNLDLTVGVLQRQRPEMPGDNRTPPPEPRFKFTWKF